MGFSTGKNSADIVIRRIERVGKVNPVPIYNKVKFLQKGVRVAAVNLHDFPLPAIIGTN